MTFDRFEFARWSVWCRHQGQRSAAQSCRRDLIIPPSLELRLCFQHVPPRRRQKKELVEMTSRPSNQRINSPGMHSPSTRQGCNMDFRVPSSLLNLLQLVYGVVLSNFSHGVLIAQQVNLSVSSIILSDLCRWLTWDFDDQEEIVAAADSGLKLKGNK